MPTSPSALDAAHRLFADRVRRDGSPDAIAAGAEQVLADVFRSLAEWFGVAGCQALFARAILLSASGRPVLTDVRYRFDEAPHLTRFAENAREYGGEAAAEAATTVLASVIAMLAGLIGEDIAMSLFSEVPRRSTDAREVKT